MKLFMIAFSSAIIALGCQPTFGQSTNNLPPTVQGGMDEIIAAIQSGITNVYFLANPIYADKLHGKFGGELGACWTISSNVVTGVRLAYINGGLLAPEFNATLRLPIHPLKAIGLTNFVVMPFVESGVGLPVSGAKFNNVTVPGHVRNYDDQPFAILGGGIIIPIDASGRFRWGFEARYEKWVGFPGCIIEAGPYFRW